MHEDELAHLGGLGPERIELRQRQALAVDVPADGHAARAVLDRVLQHLGGEVRKLERHRGHADEPVGMLAGRTSPASRCDSCRWRARGRGPSLSHHQKSLTLTACDVDPHLVQDGDAVVEARPLDPLLERRPLDDLAGSGMSQWLCTSMTRTRRPPIETWRRAGACRRRAEKPRPATYIPAVAPATVLKKCLRFDMFSPGPPEGGHYVVNRPLKAALRYDPT